MSASLASRLRGKAGLVVWVVWGVALVMPLALAWWFVGRDVKESSVTVEARPKDLPRPVAMVSATSASDPVRFHYTDSCSEYCSNPWRQDAVEARRIAKAGTDSQGREAFRKLFDVEDACLNACDPRRAHSWQGP